MKKSTQSFWLHLLLFVIIEFIFVLVIFREVPTVNLITLVGFLHLSYWLIVVAAWWIREKYVHRVWQKFLCTYIPIIYHVVIHIYVGWVTIHEMSDGHGHHDHDTIWIIIGTIVAWILIALWEYRLHRTTHCITHHRDAHAHCHDGECEDIH